MKKGARGLRAVRFCGSLRSAQSCAQKNISEHRRERERETGGSVEETRRGGSSARAAAAAATSSLALFERDLSCSAEQSQAAWLTSSRGRLSRTSRSRSTRARRKGEKLDYVSQKTRHRNSDSSSIVQGPSSSTSTLRVPPRRTACRPRCPGASTAPGGRSCAACRRTRRRGSPRRLRAGKRVDHVSEAKSESENERGRDALRCRSSEVETPFVRFVGRKAPA